MEKALFEKIHYNFRTYSEKIVDTVAGYDYRYRRYNVKYTLVLFASPVSILKGFVEPMIRKTDTIVVLNSRFFAIVFDGVDERMGLKVSDNMFVNLEACVFGNEIFSSVVNGSEADNAEAVVRKALNTLVDEIKVSVDDMVVSR